MNGAHKLICLPNTFAYSNFLCRRWLHASLFKCGAKHAPTELILDGEQKGVYVHFYHSLLNGIRSCV